MFYALLAGIVGIAAVALLYQWHRASFGYWPLGADGLRHPPERWWR